MRLYRNAIILTVILGLLIGAYVIVKHNKPTVQPTTQTEDTSKALRVFELEKEKIKEVTVDGKDGKFVFAMKDASWAATSPADMKIDISKVDSIVTNMAYLTADKLIEENATDLAKYGLDKPYTTSVKMDDGKEWTVEIGALTATKDGYYIKQKGGNKVYTVSDFTGGELSPSKNTLRNKFIFSTKSEDIIGFSMEKAGNVVFTVKKLGADNWTLTNPIEGNVNMTNLQPIITTVTSSAILDFVEDNAADLAKYGLDKPSYSLEVEYSYGKTKLLLGAETLKGSKVYAKMADSNEVFIADETSINFLDKPLKEVVEVFAYIVDIHDVSKITVNIDGRTDVSEIQTDSGGDADKDKFFFNGKDATVKDENNKSLFRKYYQGLIGMGLSDTEPGAVPSGKADITITYDLKKAPGKMVVEFIPKDDRSYYVVRNGKYGGILVSKDVFNEDDGLRPAYKKLTEAMANNKK